MEDIPAALLIPQLYPHPLFLPSPSFLLQLRNISPFLRNFEYAENFLIFPRQLFLEILEDLIADSMYVYTYVLLCVLIFSRLILKI